MRLNKYKKARGIFENTIRLIDLFDRLDGDHSVSLDNWNVW